MSDFVSVDPKSLTLKPFSAIDDGWMLITAGTPERCNTMTASWGGLGTLWSLPMATCYVRPQRYTRQFMDESEYFTLSLFGEEHRRALALCGRESGRDVDKVKACGFTVERAECGAPYFAQAELVLVCRKRYAQRMDGAAIPADVKAHHYPSEDYHIMYFGEVVEVLKRA